MSMRNILLVLFIFCLDLYAKNGPNVSLDFECFKYHLQNLKYDTDINVNSISLEKDINKFLNYGFRISFVNDVKTDAGGFVTLSVFNKFYLLNLNQFFNPYIEIEIGGGGGANQPSGKGTFYTFSIGNKMKILNNISLIISYKKGRFFTKGYINPSLFLKNPGITINSFNLGLSYDFNYKKFNNYKIFIEPEVSYGIFNGKKYPNKNNSKILIGANIIFPIDRYNSIIYNVRAIAKGEGSGYMEDTLNYSRFFYINNNLIFSLETGIGASGGGNSYLTKTGGGMIYNLNASLKYKYFKVALGEIKSFKNSFGYKYFSLLYSKKMNFFDSLKNLYVYIRFQNPKYSSNREKKLYANSRKRQQLYYLGIDKFFDLKSVPLFYGFTTNFLVYSKNKPKGVGGYAEGLFNFGYFNKKYNFRTGYEIGASGGGNLETDNIKSGFFFSKRIKNYYFKYEYFNLLNNKIISFHNNIHTISFGFRF